MSKLTIEAEGPIKIIVENEGKTHHIVMGQTPWLGDDEDVAKQYKRWQEREGRKAEGEVDPSGLVTSQEAIELIHGQGASAPRTTPPALPLSEWLHRRSKGRRAMHPVELTVEEVQRVVELLRELEGKA